MDFLNEFSIYELEAIKVKCDELIKSIKAKQTNEAFKEVAEAWKRYREVTEHSDQVWVTVDEYCEHCNSGIDCDIDVFDEMDALIRNYEAGLWTP